MIHNVTVIGAGTMGNGIAHVFAQAGFKVNIVDVSLAQLDRAVATITKNLDRQISKGACTEETKKHTLSNIKCISEIIEGVKDADLVIEAATENIELKLKIFDQLDEYSPKHAILATNTSSISVTKNCPHYQSTRQSNRHALYESCAGNETGRSNKRLCNKQRSNNYNC